MLLNKDKNYFQSRIRHCSLHQDAVLRLTKKATLQSMISRKASHLNQCRQPPGWCPVMIPVPWYSHPVPSIACGRTDGTLLLPLGYTRLGLWSWVVSLLDHLRRRRSHHEQLHRGAPAVMKWGLLPTAIWMSLEPVLQTRSSLKWLQPWLIP